MSELFFLVPLGIIMGIVIGGGLVGLFLSKRLTPLETQKNELTTALATEQANRQIERQTLQDQIQQLQLTQTTLTAGRDKALIEKAKFETLANEAAQLKQDYQGFFENLSQKILKERAAELTVTADKKQQDALKSIETLLSPLKDLIHRNDKDTHALRTELDRFLTLNHEWLSALRSSKGRGDWGELELYRLLEESGVTFEKQPATQGLRPDVKVPLTNGRCLFIDVKTIVGHLTQLTELSSENGDEAMQREQHAKALAREVQKLSAKSYEGLTQESVDFVVLFVPRESMLRVALEVQPDLMDVAFRQNVILASPLIMMALLKTVAYEWQQFRLSEDADTIKTIGQELYKRSVTLINKFDKLGTQLNTAISTYEETQRSLSSRFIPQLKRFEAMGCGQTKNPLPENLVEMKTATHLVATVDASTD